MKISNLIYLSIIILASLLFSACGNEESKDKEKSNLTESSNGDSKEVGDAKDCDEFIDQYEEWMDNYMDLLEKYIKNPMDAELSTEYLKLAQDGMKWMNQWNSELYFCASQEKYQKRFDEISERAEKKMEELGID